MKLTKRELNYLIECGENEDAINQVKEIVSNGYLKITIERYNKKEQPIAYDKAKRMLGWETFIGAIHRASFHWSCARKINDYVTIYFDASDYFKS